MILLKDLNSSDAHLLVTDFESAYYHFLKTVHDPSDPYSLSIIKQFEPIILDDITKLTKFDIIEGLMREYDLMQGTKKSGRAK